jgi:hypothetical protein
VRDFAISHVSDERSLLAGKAGAALLAGLALAWLKPFGFAEDHLFLRLGFWTSMSAAWFLVSSLMSLLLGQSSFVRALSLQQRWALTLIASTLPGAVIAGAALNQTNDWHPGGTEGLELLGRTLLVGLILEALSAAILGQTPMMPRQLEEEHPLPDEDRDGEVGPHSISPVNKPLTPRAPILLGRIPPDLRGAFLCLQMEDHYVRVHTSKGSALILTRLSDAVLELEGVSGLRVHRSWWVATEAVQTARRVGRTAQLSLSNGLVVPVSRPYLAEVIALFGERAADRPAVAQARNK